ncbi:MAG: lipopolysaccharide biosynthesis protein [Candidatus Neomarinimicrobiota bacterium]|nr:MAG: lipopolysaccharide biosynthesis protein [Candidatus Neomarinimicrobiota bacterium]
MGFQPPNTGTASEFKPTALRPEISVTGTFLSPGSFGKKVGLLFSGNLLSQLILVLAYPVIGRLYSPHDLGTYEQVNSLLMILLFLASFRFDTTLLLAGDEREYYHLTRLAYLALALVVVIVSLGLMLFGKRYVAWQQNPHLTPYLFWAVVFLLLAGLRQIRYNGLVYRNRIRLATAADVVNSGGNSLLRIGFGLWSPGPLSLFLSRFVALSVSLLSMGRIDRKDRKSGIKWAELKTTFQRFRGYAFFMSLGSTINRMATYLVPLILASFLGPVFLGAYAMANSTLSIPAAVLRKAVNTIYMREASEKKSRSQNLYPQFRKITLAIFFLGLGPLVVLLLWAPEIYTFVLGPRWTSSGHISRIICSWIFISLVAVPSISLVSVLRLERFYAGYQAVLLGSRLLLLFGLHVYFTRETPFLVGLTLHGVLFNIFLMGFMFKRLQGYRRVQS